MFSFNMISRIISIVYIYIYLHIFIYIYVDIYIYLMLHKGMFFLCWFSPWHPCFRVSSNPPTLIEALDTMSGKIFAVKQSIVDDTWLSKSAFGCLASTRGDHLPNPSWFGKGKVSDVSCWIVPGGLTESLWKFRSSPRQLGFFLAHRTGDCLIPEQLLWVNRGDLH